jgi:hypothetical protein
MNRKLITHYSLLIIILIIAVFLRLYNITETPPGLYPDEAIYANNGVEAWETGNFKVFYPENNGREGLWPNIVGFFAVKFGHEPWAPRSVAAIFGILTVLGVYLLAKELFHENPKHEARSPKQYQNSNVQNQKRFRILNFKNWNLFRISDLEFRISHGEKIALLSSFFLAVSFWHILFSRIGFRAIMAPMFLTWSLYFLLKSLNQVKNKFQILSLRGISRRETNSKFQTDPNAQNSKFQKFRILDFGFWILPLLAGAVYGLGFHSYIAYRATPLLILIIFVLYWFSILRTSDVPNIDGNNFRTSDVQKLNFTRKKILLSTFYFLLSTVIVAAPLGLYFIEHPQDFFGRTTQVSIFTSPTPLKDLGMNIIKTAGMFNFVGDWNWRHNFAGRPQLFWPVGILFLIGVFLVIKSLIQNSKFKIQNDNSKLKNKFAFWILLTWIITTALPVVISNEGLPHALRAILMVPPVFILAGLGGVWLYEKALTKIRNNTKVLKLILLSAFCFLLSLLVVEAYTAYFILWGKNYNVQGAFSADYVKSARELNSLPKTLPKYVVVEASGVDVRGIPMPAQTVMFITDTFTPEKQKEKNLYYVLPKDINRIPPDAYSVIVK